MHIDKICFTIYYYSPTCFGRFCDHHQGVTQEYIQYTNNCILCVLLVCYVSIKYSLMHRYGTNIDR